MKNKHVALVAFIGAFCLFANTVCFSAEETVAAPGKPDKGIGEDELAASTSLGQATQGEDGLSMQTMCTNCNEASLDLGGFGDQHIEVCMDGFQLLSGMPRIYAFSILPAPVVEKLEIRSGPGLARNASSAIGGVVDVSSRAPERRPDIHASVETGTYGWSKQSIMAGGLYKRVSGRVAATRLAFDAIDADGDGNVETGVMDQWSAFAELGLDFGRGGVLTLGGKRIRDEQIDGHGAVEKDFWTGRPIGYLKEDTILGWTGYHAGYDLDLAGGHTISMRVTSFDRELELNAPPDFSFEPKRNRYDILEEDIHGEIVWEGPVGSRWRLSAGASFLDDVNTVSGGSMPFHLRVLEEAEEGWGLFVQADVDVSRSVEIAFGSRYDDFEYSSCRKEPEIVWPPEPACETVTGDQWSPRLSLNWKPVGSFQIKTSLGYGLQVPKPIFNEICCGQTPERNARVLPEESRSLAVDLTFQPNPSFKLNTYLHHSEFDNYIVKMVAGSVDLKQKLMHGNITSATVDGVSAFMSWKVDRGFSVSASATLLDANNDGDTITLYPNVFEPVSQISPVTLPLERIPYMAERKGQLALRYGSRKTGNSGQIQAQYTGPMLIQQYWNIPGGLGVLPPGGLLPFYRETPGFWTVGLSGKIAVHEHLEMFLGADNIFDEVQDDLDDFSTDYNWGPIRGRYVYLGLSYNY